MNPYSYKFTQHVKKFMQKHKMISSGQYLLAVSGGVDSMVLMDVFIKLGLNFCVAHVHHGTRKAQDEAEALVRSFCFENGIEYHAQFTTKLGLKNFESSAREVRYHFFHQLLGDNEKLVLGHHLDDSFEWYLMHQFKSSNTKVLGIPCSTRVLIRPLMCVSKDQILNYAKVNNIDYWDDETNLDTSFERNYIRSLIQNNIKKRYPRYLFHYVHRMNALIKSSDKDLKLKLYKRKNCALLEVDREIDALKMVIKEIIHHLSLKNRGKLESQIDKIKDLIQNNKTGPLSFSGSVKVLYKKGMLFFYNKNHSSDPLSKVYQKMTYAEFNDLYSRLKRSHPGKFPFYLSIQKERFKVQKAKKHLITGENFKQDFVEAYKLKLEWQKHKKIKTLSVSF
jgi:tRNA(Ile)-lysidine synthase